MKTTLGVGISVLSALAAQGKDFDRAANVGNVNLLSNGRILDEKTIDFCAKRGIHLSISMPGLTTFNANTDSDTEVTKILSHFQYAKSVGCTTTVGIRWDEWRKLPDEPEWMHMARHDRLPVMCGGCDKAVHCAGGCREAARVFRGSPLAPDPVCENVKPIVDRIEILGLGES